jgi:hypothetical protein
MQSISRRWRALAGLAVALAISGSTIRAQTASNTPREEFTAFAVNMSNVGRAGASQVDIRVDRYSSDAEHEALMAVFKKDGPEALLSALQKTRPVGTIRTPDSLAYDLHYARQAPADEGGRRIVLATDRPIGFWEAANRPRSIDYPFTVIELQMDGNGEGVGKLSIATKLTLSGTVLTLENFANQPVLLNNVRQRK